MFAAQQGDADSARILLSAGANPNEVMHRTGWTALIIASAMGQGKAVAMLLDAGADPNAVDANGFTALHRAVRGESDRGVDPESKVAAVGIVRALLAHGANPNARLKQEKPMIAGSGITLEGATPLALAAEVNNLDAVRVLVEGGADPQIPTVQNTTPLMLAVGAGIDVSRPRSPEERATAVETARLLVERGADVNAAGQFGWTALHAAAYQGLNDVIEFLAGKGAKLDAMDGFGQTPLSICYAVVTRGIGDAYYQTPRYVGGTQRTASSNWGPPHWSNPVSWSSTSAPRDRSSPRVIFGRVREKSHGRHRRLSSADWPPSHSRSRATRQTRCEVRRLHGSIHRPSAPRDPFVSSE
jgi:ankyrin repeat protein